MVDENVSASLAWGREEASRSIWNIPGAAQNETERIDEHSRMDDMEDETYTWGWLLAKQLIGPCFRQLLFFTTQFWAL